MSSIITDQNNYVKDSLAKYYLQLFLLDIDMTPDKLDFLKRNNYVVPDMFDISQKGTAFSNQYRSFKEITSSPIEEYFTEDLTASNIADLKDGILTYATSYKKNTQLGEITKEMWTPDGLKVDYENEFWMWINTINMGWQYYKPYRKFDLYRQQAYNWLAENLTFDK